ncbi:hypothetical protein S7335_4093 [Synechococcus sp. PCC 7335]|nr:hypothetical protein S7335_4093 [Synechococcus sp. PCC 7335]
MSYGSCCLHFDLRLYYWNSIFCDRISRASQNYKRLTDIGCWS